VSKGWDTRNAERIQQAKCSSAGKIPAGIFPAMKPMLLLCDRSFARTCGIDDSRRDCAVRSWRTPPSIKGTPAVRSGKQDVGSGTADDRTENRNWLFRGGNIRNGQGKPIAALEFLRSRIVGLQIDSDDVYIGIVDKRSE
jgi:hypothetical protein